MTAIVWQVENNRAYQLSELAMKSPDNTTSATCREFTRLYNSHTSGLFVYGDPSGNNEGTRNEAGYNDFFIIQRELAKYNPVLRVATSHPPVHIRGQFINSVFESSFGECSIYIQENSVYLKNDLLFGKEASDGTKLKEKVKVDGVSYEKYHHMSDAMDYFICEIFALQFETYQRGDMSQYKREYGSNARNESKRM